MRITAFSLGVWTTALVIFISMVMCSAARADFFDQDPPSRCVEAGGDPTAEELRVTSGLAQVVRLPKVFVILDKCWDTSDDYEAIYRVKNQTVFLREKWRSRSLGWFALVHEMRHHRQSEMGVFFDLGWNGRECDAYAHTAKIATVLGNKWVAAHQTLVAQGYCETWINENLKR